ncbi:O-antigen ligase family protein [Aequorivita echinoideorum]|nr:O-antigen ligase family protein [Aequorivita echinoideorum]
MAFFLPLKIEASNFFLILFFLGSAYYLFIKKQWVLRDPKTLLFTTLPIFLLNCIGLFYSSPAFEGTKILGRNIAFLLCPLLLFFYAAPTLKGFKKNLFNGLVVGCVTSLVILLTNNFLNYFATRPLLRFDDEIFNYYYTYYYFTHLFEIHPTYLGAYVVLAIGILFEKIFSPQKRKLLFFLGVLILSIGIVFINSRIIFLLYTSLLTFFILKAILLFYRRKKMRYLIMTIGACVIISVFTVFALSNTFIISRITDELSWELTDQVGTAYNEKVDSDSRIARWKSGLEAFNEKPVFGYGTHSEKDLLARYYKKNGLLTALKNRYDSHNIYLSFALEFGMFGLLILLFYLFSNLFFALKSKNFIYFLLFSMVVTICCFESYLKNNAAITFVAMFGTVLFFLNFEAFLNKPQDESR